MSQIEITILLEDFQFTAPLFYICLLALPARTLRMQSSSSPGRFMQLELRQLRPHLTR